MTSDELCGSAGSWLDLVRALVLIRSVTGRVEYVNEWTSTLLGYSKNEMIRKNWFEHFLPEDVRKETIKNFNLLLENKMDPLPIRENYVQTKNGDVLRIQWHDRLLKDNNGNVVGVFSSGEDITEKLALKTHLASQRAQNRKDLLHAVLMAAERERRQIALELHDSINQELTVCKLLIDAEIHVADPEAKRMKKVSMLLQKIITDIREVSHRLHPAGLGKEGLYDSVKVLVAGINTTGKVKVNLKVEGTKFMEHVPDDTALSLFRILQEALNNILRHANAQEVQVSITCDASALDLEISDDGKGFVKKDVISDLGLKNIYTRAEAAGGKAFITSTPGEGTLLSVHIPREQ